VRLGRSRRCLVEQPERLGARFVEIALGVVRPQQEFKFVPRSSEVLRTRLPLGQAGTIHWHDGERLGSRRLAAPEDPHLRAIDETRVIGIHPESHRG
jgi:hypothetical protein